MKNRFKLIVTASVFVFSYQAQARENIGTPPATSHSQVKSIMTLCAPAAAKEDLDINNVRATILTGGDMWWNLTDGKYLVPKPAAGANGPTSLFAGSLWIGGIDASNTLKIAAMTYRQTGNDFWPGPLTSSATTDATTCLTWDKFFKINKGDVKTYIDWFNQGQIGANPTDVSAMDVIYNWPATGPEGQPMAPFYDANGDGLYDPYTGDYPDFWLGDGSRPAGQTACDAQLFGDQVLFWVFNDKGNVHSETGGASIGLEVQAQAFAFQTNDEINNMTFYHYKVINKSSFRLDSTFFGVWVDPDLGSASDDFVGCDVGLGLGYCYNGDLVDDNPPSGQIPYGANPPAIGCDFFEGPYADPNGADDPAASVPASFVNYGDAIADNERLGMAKFVYYNNDFSFTGNPSGAVDFYNYLAGSWKDGTPITYGGTGHLTGTACDYMFPGASDPTGFGTGGSTMAPWSEETSADIPADRRFLQSAGPFTLQPGAVNTVTIGLVWARASQGGNLASVTLMKGADAKAQDLFNNCFALLNGPDAPNLTIQELENELILSWTNPATSNNYNENYSEDYDKSTGADSLYRFQGYIVYQLKDEQVTAADLYNVDKARIVLQCDKTDNVKQIVNFKNDVALQALVPQEMVNGSDLGIVHSLNITEDKFAIGNTKLVNHKTYYFAIIAYGYTPTLVTPNYAIPKDYLPFISGNKSADGTNGFNHSAIPHTPSPESGGTEAHSTYGTGPKLTRIEGHGNGGNILDLTAGSVSEILSSSRAVNPTYENTRGPVNIKVVDPLNVPVDNSFEFKLIHTTSSATWELINLTTVDTVFSEKTIAVANEQIINGQPSGSSTFSIPTWGISVNVLYTSDPGTATSVKNGFLEGTVSFADNTKQWLSGLADEEGTTYSNWIRSGSGVFTAPDNIYNDATGTGTDANQEYENIIGKTWAPYRLCATGLGGTSTDPSATSVYAKGAPAWPTNISLNKLSNIASVDVVITSDQSLWTRCPVLEECDDKTLSEGNARKLFMRAHASVDKNGLSVGQSGYNAADGDLNGTTGMGWFPGYAINLETGERLNMAFGEDSWLTTYNGNDMKWNPTSTRYASNGDPIFGGKHYVYVFGHNGDAVYPATDAQLPNALRDVPRYDQGKVLHDLLNAAANTFVISSTGTSDAYKREVFNDAMWVNIPMLAAGHTYFESAVQFRLRVAKSYQKGYTAAVPSSTDTTATPQNSNNPMYTFNTSDIETHKNDATTAANALDLINIVPNPYYAYSGYEKKALDNIVKITNLPEKCNISIYTLNGTLIRKYSKDDTKTSLDWDLKNQARVPIASGMYIIYIKVPDVGEKTLKWFGVLRPIDLDSY
ncbi:MAG: T9SS type A sorting domain-containing protein [Bacteroidetes bacterium]|nr:T9SS type A sorting domain-containing protein [Bacteroidota bacterium]